MQEALQKYLRAFKRLRIDRAHGIAPHKPILLISVLQNFQNGINDNKRIYITPDEKEEKVSAYFKTDLTKIEIQ